jgi:hypothetical protein
VWSSCKAHDAMEWQRHFERHATPQMGRNCGFWFKSRKIENEETPELVLRGFLTARCEEAAD